MTQLPIIPSSPDRMAIHPFQQQPSQLRIGSPTFSNPSKSKPHKPMSEQLETIILSTNSLSSTTQSSIASLREGNVFTTKTPIENDSLSPKTSSSEWSPTFDNATSSHDDVNFFAALCVGFAGFLRAGEFTWEQWSPFSSPRLHLSRQHVTFDNRTGSVTILLPSSKTDPLAKGTEIHLPATGTEICPVAALHHLFERFPAHPAAPLFCRHVGPFSRSHFILSRELRQLSSTSGSTPANSLAIHYEKVQRSQPIAKVSHALRSSFSVDGRAMR